MQPFLAEIDVDHWVELFKDPEDVSDLKLNWQHSLMERKALSQPHIILREMVH